MRQTVDFIIYIKKLLGNIHFPLALESRGKMLTQDKEEDYLFKEKHSHLT